MPVQEVALGAGCNNPQIWGKLQYDMDAERLTALALLIRGGL